MAGDIGDRAPRQVGRQKRDPLMNRAERNDGVDRVSFDDFNVNRRWWQCVGGAGRRDELQQIPFGVRKRGRYRMNSI